MDDRSADGLNVLSAGYMILGDWPLVIISFAVVELRLVGGRNAYATMAERFWRFAWCLVAWMCDGTLVLGSIKGGKVLVVGLMPLVASLFVLVWLLPR